MPDPPPLELLSPDEGPVLVVMIDHHMGNMVVSMPVVAALVSYFRCPVDVLVDERYHELAATALPARRVMAYPSSDSKGGRTMGALRRAPMLLRLAGRYRAVIDVTSGTSSALISLLTLARRRIGLEQRRRRWMYTRLIARDLNAHAFLQYQSILACIGKPSVPMLRLSAPETAKRALDDSLRPLLPRADASLAVMHPSAGKIWRVWPVDRFAKVADHLHQRWGMTVCLIGAPGEIEMLRDLRARMTQPRGAVCLTLPVIQLLALFERAAILVSNESGPTHLAAATGVPIATIFGPSKEAKWKPIRSDRVVVLRGEECDPRCARDVCVADRRCLMALMPQAVIDKADSLIQS